MSSKLVIFDFDGVLVDSFDAWHKINACAFKQVLGKVFTRQQYRDCYLGVVDKCLRKFAGSADNYKRLNAVKRKYKNIYSRVKLFPLAKRFIYLLNKPDFKLVMVTSSTNPAGVLELLKKFKLEKNFAAVISSKGENKVPLLKQILKRFDCKPSDTYFITDTYNDIKWGKQVGVKTIAVDWGFHDKKTLRKAVPDFIVKNYHEIIRLCN